MYVGYINGIQECIFNDNDLVDVIDRLGGADLAQIVSAKLDRARLDEIYAKERARADADSLEEGLNDLQDDMKEVRCIVDKMEEYLISTKIVDKKVLLDLIEQISTLSR